MEDNNMLNKVKEAFLKLFSAGKPITLKPVTVIVPGAQCSFQDFEKSQGVKLELLRIIKGR
jgi:hypothetical protein